MFDADIFEKSLLPGNYALTKSMELTKVNSCGTLWYMKKFIVLYYYVFLSDTDFLLTRKYIERVRSSFDEYIDGLDEEVRAAAKKFFYPDDAAINFRSSELKIFASFAGNADFADQNERKEYYRRAQKWYFMLLMNAGGQTGIKKKLKERMKRAGFVYSRRNVESAIDEAAVEICAENLLGGRAVLADNSVKRILSARAVAELNKLRGQTFSSKTQALRLAEKITTAYPADAPEYVGILNDVHAFIRNERQILYHYGYFHSRSSGAMDEFSSLTPVGEISINANAKEFAALWEHQKIKMISQPPTVTIKKVTAKKPAAFAVGYTPYTDIIGCLCRQNEFTLEGYRFVVSRRKHIFAAAEWNANEKSLLTKNLPRIKAAIEKFGRDRDLKEEDGRKELLKYILGIRDDLQKDAGTNPLGICRFGDQKVSCTDKKKTRLLYRFYDALNEYKLQRYGELFAACENDLRQRYVAAAKNEERAVDAQVKIGWDFYNIRPDKVIALGVIFVSTAAALNICETKNLGGDELSRIGQYAFRNYGNMLKYFGIKSDGAIRAEFARLLGAVSGGDFSAYLLRRAHESDVAAEYRRASAADLRKKIETMSETLPGAVAERVRNVNLVKLIKSYYMKRYAENDKLKCECCGGEAFVTERNEPYLEFHHLIPFGEADGPDHYLNLFALCPNCHRKIHHLKLTEKNILFSLLDKNNYYGQTIVGRLKKLRKKCLLKSYHLEYLLSQNAITKAEYEEIAA